MNQIKDFIEYITQTFKLWVIIQPWERAIRVRSGKYQKLLKEGVHFRIPFFDSVYVQTTRLRVVSMPPQTVTSTDGQTITAIATIGYSIESIEKLYNTLYHPETTIANMAMGAIAEYIQIHTAKDCRASDIEKYVLSSLNSEDHGIKYEYCKMTGFAIARTIRLIQDSAWTYEGLTLDDKK